MKSVWRTAILSALVLVFIAACASFKPAQDLIQVDLKGQCLPAGTVDGEFDNIFNKTGLSKKDIAVSYYPQDDVACLQFRYEFTTYYQFWGKSHRTAFITALEKYKTDYAQRDLTEKNTKSKRRYGTERMYVIWESSQFSQQGFSYPNVELGYRFVKGSPYFSVTMQDELNENPLTKEMMPSSSNTILYFTRAQAENLAASFNQEYLRSLRPVEKRTGSSEGEIDNSYTDAYTEGNF